MLGRDYTPGFTAGGTNDYGGYGLWGTNLGNWTNGFGGAAAVRWSNGIHYTSPNLGGLTIRAAYATGESAVTPKTSGNNIGISGVYAAGPFSANLFYHDMKDVVAAGAAQTKTKQMGGGGTVTFGPAKILLGYFVSDPDGATKLTGINLGVNYALGGGTLVSKAIV